MCVFMCVSVCVCVCVCACVFGVFYEKVQRYALFVCDVT